MCGIAGILSLTGGAEESTLRRAAEQQAQTLRHRGPDAGGVWVDAAAGVALAHRRLSIVDLSEAGSQPMASSCGRFVVTYNGELYNTEDLRAELAAAGRAFRGHSDTEVMVEAFSAWGVRKTLDRLNGMFAFAVWDRAERRLTLARDRLGIKPLYWVRTPRLVLFGSELKALRCHPECPAEIDRDAVAAFLRHNYVPAPRTILAGVRKLQPGRLLNVDAGGGEVSEESYWDLEAVARAGRQSPFQGSDDEAIDVLETLLADAVKRQEVADVPLGVFLSGGIDSSTVCALMQASAARPVRSFSIGFAETRFDESHHAAAVAAHLGTDHTALTVTPHEARDAIPEMAQWYDEPFADSSQIPTFLLSKLTREHVTVALSGDGGDELFGGYTRYFTARIFDRYVTALPASARRLGGAMIRGIPPGLWDAVFRMVPAHRRPAHAGDRLHKLAAVLPEGTEGFYRRLISHWRNPDAVVIDGFEPKGLPWDAGFRQRIGDPLDWMQALDGLTYLPDDILTKVDRASMAHALEVRVPLLDHRVAEFAWTLPRSMTIRGNEGKWLLRRVLDRHVPRELVERPKMGFGIPVGEWLRGPLRDWADDLLSETALARHGLLNPGPVRAAWTEHRAGQRNWQYHLWDVLMLQAWCDQWMTGAR